MTKIEETRIQPGGIEAIDQLRKIAHRHEAGTVNEVLIDAPSAAVTVQLFDALNPKNQAKILTFPVGMIVEVAWELNSGLPITRLNRRQNQQ